MEKSNLMKLVAIGLIIFAIGVGVGKYSLPSKSSTSESELIETEKEREVIERERTNPDGSKEKERIVKDTTRKKEENTKVIVVENKKPDWKVSGLVGYSFRDVEQTYGLNVERRILGSLSVGVFGLTNRTVGLSIGYEF